MSLSRRRFLQILGGTAAAAVVAPSLVLPEAKIATLPRAPLFVPSQNLDFGVPTGRLVAATDSELARIDAEIQLAERGYATWDDVQRPRQRVPMLLLQDQYLLEYGGRLAAGTEVMVDGATAGRWRRLGIAVRGRSAPSVVQARDAERMAKMVVEEKQQPSYRYDAWDPMHPVVHDRAQANILIREMLRA